MPRVGIVMGSSSDDPVAQEVVQVLEQLGIDYEVRVLSAHRAPGRLASYVEEAPERGVELFIGLAGGAAALPGAIAAWTTLPVLGVPVASSELKGIDALMAIAQMPPGVPVGCMAVGNWGARNAAFMAASILGLKYEEIKKAYEEYRRRQREG